MGLIRRSVRKFTKAESFRLFMEGVRALQLYDDEADREADENLLNQYLENAETFFRRCVDTYPKDILPRYYFGLVLSIRGQIQQARQLRTELQGIDPAAMVNDPDILFLQAAKAFEITAERVGGGDLLAYAQYNQAQALAKTGPTKQ